jgi:hypothetical protein
MLKPTGDDALAGLRSHQMVEDHEGVREQRPRARPPEAAMGGNEVAIEETVCADKDKAQNDR